MSLASYRRIERLHARYHTHKACRVCEIVWRHMARSGWISARDMDYAV
jgi:hypothetical protein